MTIDICYLISHGFVARMLLQTGLIDQLAAAGLRVGIISLDPKDENLAHFANHPQVQLFQWKEKSSIWDDNYLHKRMYFLENIDGNTALKEKFYNGLFFSGSKHPWKRMRPLWYYLIYRLIKFFPSLRNSFVKQEGKHLLSKEANRILEEMRPRLLVSAYPVSIMEAKLLYAAKQKNIPTLLQLLSWDNISTKGKFPVVPEKFIVWGQIMKDELLEYYQTPSEAIHICGVPHFDEHIKVRGTDEYKPIIADLEIDASKPYLFFAMSSPRFAPREIDIVEWLCQAVNEDKFGNDMQLVIRPHPQNVQTFMAKESWLKRLEALPNHRIAVDYPSLHQSALRWSMKKEDMVRLAKMMAGCSICLNSGSTISIEALLHNKPVLLTSFDGHASIPYWNSARRLIDYNHLRKLVERKAVRPVKSYRDLENTIRAFLENPDLDKESREATKIAQCYTDDGQATSRVVNTLQSILKELD